MSDDIPVIDPNAWREQFPITQKTVYMISNSLGAMPRSTRDNLNRYADIWEARGVRSWAEGWWVKQNDLAEHFSQILGVPASALSLHQNVTMASAVFASSLRFDSPRNKIVYTDMNFPTIMYLYDGIARQHGARVVRVESPDGIGVPTEKLLDAIDEETALVPISHVLFRSSFIQDAQTIVEKARRVGAIVVLDVYQSVGCIPLELHKWGVHAAVGGPLKFCCGGPGSCFLYVDPELCQELAPAYTGWMAHKQPFDFDTGPIDRREDGWRFLHGTPNVPGLFAAEEGVRICAEIGMEAVRKHSMKQTQLIWETAQELGLKSTAPENPEQRGGTIAIDAPHGYEVCQELLARDFIVDYRPKAGVRIAPHFYTLDEECVATVHQIRKILDSKAYEKHLGQEKRPG